MNEQIHMLAERSDAYADHHCSKVERLEPGESWTSIRNNKFAELIIRECIGVIGEENYTMLTGKAYCTALKRHFGVEK
jgi:hypothetical protein